jgi:hypothetical protein
MLAYSAPSDGGLFRVPSVRSVLLLLVLALLGFAAACGGDDDDASEREASLLAAADTAYSVFARGEIDEFYEHFSSGFRERCPLDAFRRAIAANEHVVGEPAGTVTFEGETTARVRVRLVDDSSEVIEGGSQEDDFLHLWTLEDGEWKADSAENAPCAREE